MSVTLTDDALSEDSEWFALQLEALVGATTLDPAAIARIHRNDGQVVSQPTISIDDVTVDETQAYADVVVRLSAPGTSPVSVRYATSNDLARYGSAAVRFDSPRLFAKADSTIAYAFQRPYRPWHEQRRFSRDARGLPPYRKQEPPPASPVPQSPPTERTPLSSGGSAPPAGPAP